MIDRDDFEKILQDQAKASQIPLKAGPEPTRPGGSDKAGRPASALSEKIGTEVTLRGVARHAALGAVVLLDNGVPVYLEGRDEWDDAVSSKRVEVTGTLRRKKLAPDPEIGPDGGISHGAYGTDYVLESPSFSVLSD